METTKFKKSLSILLSIVMLITICTVSFSVFASEETETTAYADLTATSSGDCTGSYASDDVENDSVQWAYYDEIKTLVISGTGAMQDFTSNGEDRPWIDTTNKDYVVETVIVEDGVTYTGAYCFKYFYAMTSISLPKSLVCIGNHTFFECTALTTLVIPEGVTSMLVATFRGCDALEVLVLPSTLTAIGNNTFYSSDATVGLTSLSTIICGGYWSNITSWGTGNDTISDVTVTTIENVSVDTKYQIGTSSTYWSLSPDLTLTISGTGDMDACGQNAFPWEDLSTVVRSIEIGDKVTSIAAYAFYDFTALEGTLVIPDNITILGNYAFRGCSSITALYVGNGVATLPNRCFAACTSLKTAVIGDSVTTIETNCFTSCTSMTTMSLPANQITVDAAVFNGTSPTAVYYPLTADDITIDTTSNAHNDSLVSALVYNHVCSGSGGKISVFEAATCLEYSKTYYTGATCETCGRANITTISYGTEYADCTPVAVADVAATCTTTGLTGKTVCSVCDKVINEGTVIATTAHTYEACTDGNYTEPKCGVDGFWTVTCTAEDCNETTTVTDDDSKLTCEYPTATELYDYTAVELAAAGITYTPATCANDASWADVPCNLCGSTTTTITDEDSQEDHAFTEFVETVAPSCSEEGYTIYQCSMCTATENRDYTDTTAHTYKYIDATDSDGNVIYEVDDEGNATTTAVQVRDGVYTSGTCASDGYTTYTCTECGDKEVVYSDTDLASNYVHKYEVNTDLETESTCTVAGETHYECVTCDASYVEYKELAAHNYLIFEKVYQAGTCQSNSINEVRCIDCDAIGYVEVQDTYGECEDADGDSFCDTCGAIVEDSFWDKLIRFFLEFFEVIASWFE